MNNDRMIQLCGGGRCPRVFEREDGSWVVQGPVATNSAIEAANPTATEAVVELPADVVAELVARLRQR